MAEEAAARAVDMMRGSNPRTERSAMLHGESSPTAVMQFVRLVRESENPHRRLFSDPEALLSWVGEVLSPDELRRARVPRLTSDGSQRTEVMRQRRAQTPIGGSQRDRRDVAQRDQAHTS